MRGRYVHRLRPEDIGSRVSVRRWVDEPGAGRRVPSDVVGRLVAWEGGTLTITTRRGDAVEVDEADVLASKVIPEPPSRLGGGTP